MRVLDAYTKTVVRSFDLNLIDDLVYFKKKIIGTDASSFNKIHPSAKREL